MLYTVLFTFVITFFFVTILAYTEKSTRAIVEKNRKNSIAQAAFEALGVEATDTGTAQLFEGKTLFTVHNGKLVSGGERVDLEYFKGSGLWGPIEGYIATTENKERIWGISILSHNETPGLGGRITEEWFLEQFRGERINGEILLNQNPSVGGDSDYENSSFDAISGATLTSRAFKEIINEALNETTE